MSFRAYRLLVDDALQAEMDKHGLGPNEVLQMARESAPYVDPFWTRQFEGYVLRIEGDLVRAIGEKPERQSRKHRAHNWARGCWICKGQARMITYEVCSSCNGRGCSHCASGARTVERICPMARERKHTPCSQILEQASKSEDVT
jgi:hypothetical protein